MVPGDVVLLWTWQFCVNSLTWWSEGSSPTQWFYDSPIPYLLPQCCGAAASPCFSASTSFTPSGATGKAQQENWAHSLIFIYWELVTPSRLFFRPTQSHLTGKEGELLLVNSTGPAWLQVHQATNCIGRAEAKLRAHFGHHYLLSVSSDMFQLYPIHCGENKDDLWQLVAFAGHRGTAAHWLHADTGSVIAWQIEIRLFLVKMLPGYWEYKIKGCLEILLNAADVLEKAMHRKKRTTASMNLQSRNYSQDNQISRSLRVKISLKMP